MNLSVSNDRNGFFQHLYGVPVSSLLLKEEQKIVSLNVNQTVDEALKILSENKIVSAPVVDENGKSVCLSCFVKSFS